MVTGRAHKANPVLSKDDLRALVRVGETGVVATASASSVVRMLAPATASKPRPYLVTVGKALPEGYQPGPKLFEHHHLPVSHTGATVARLLNKATRGVSSGSLIIIDISSLPVLTGIRIFSALLTSLRSRKARIWWIVSPSWLEGKAVPLLKEHCAYLASATTNADGSVTFHFVAATHTLDPAFFLPHRLTDQTAAALESPLPVRSPSELLFDSLPAGLLVYAKGGTLDLVNRWALDALGFSESTVRDRPLRSFVARPSQFALSRFVAALRQRGRASASLVVLDSRRRRRRILAEAIALPDGRTLCYFTTPWPDDTDGPDRVRQLAGQWDLVLDSRAIAQGLFQGSRLTVQSRGMTEILDWLGIQRGQTPDWKDVFGSRGSELRKMVGNSGEVPVSAEVTLKSPEGEQRIFDIKLSQFGAGPRAAVHVGLSEVTARVKMVSRLEESETYARAIAAATETCLIVVKDGICEHANRAALAVLGFGTADEVHGKSLVDLCAPRYRSAVLDAVASGQGDARAEIRMIRKGGGQVPVDMVFRPLGSGSGSRLACVFQDAGPSRKLKSELRKAHRQHDILEPFVRRTAGRLRPDVIAREGLLELLEKLGLTGGAVLLFERGMPRLVAHEGMGEKAFSVISAQNRGEGILAYLEKTLEVIAVTIREYPAFLPLKALWEEQHAGVIVYVPLHNDGGLLGVLVAFGNQEEVDEDWPWLLAEVGAHMGAALSAATAFEALTASERHFRWIAESLPDIAYTCKANGGVEWISPQVESLVGYRAEEFVRNPEFWRSLVHPDDRSTYSERISSQQAGAVRLELHYRLLPKGKAVYLQVRDSLLYVRDAEGGVRSIAGVLTVVDSVQTGETNVRSLGVEIQALRDALSVKAAEADEFASVVSHDLKEPLITIEAYGKIVREEAGPALSDEARSYLERVVQATGRLKTLIDDLLTLSRIGRGGRVRRRVPLKDVLEEIREEMRLPLQLRHARLEFPEVLPEVYYDRTELAMVFRNLISNGLKFNRSLEPCVAVNVVEEEGGVTIAVRDNGIGIPPGDHHLVFVMFRRLNSAAEFPGTGAGLAIVKKIVERHGGRISIESSEGEGSTFYFSIPGEGGQNG